MEKWLSKVVMWSLHMAHFARLDCRRILFASDGWCQNGTEHMDSRLFCFVLAYKVHIYIYIYNYIYIPVFIHLTAIPCTWLSVSWNHGVKGSREFVTCARQIRFPNLKSFDLGESSGPKGVFWVKIGSLKGGEHWPTRDPLHFRG